MSPNAAALAAFHQRPFDLPSDADAYFADHGMGITTDTISQPLERFISLERRLILLRDSDRAKFVRMHKGTPYFFLACFAFDMKNYEKALYYLDAALNEDRRNLRDWLTAPGAQFMRLITGTQYPASRVIADLRAAVQSTWAAFQQDSGIAILHQTWNTHVIDPALQGTIDRTLICGLYVYLFAFQDRHNELELRTANSTAVTNHNMYAHLQLGGIIFETLLRAIYNPTAIKLNELLNHPSLKSDFHIPRDFKWQTRNASIAGAHQAISNTRPETAFLATARVRNAVSHTLAHPNPFANPTVFVDLSRNVTNAILYVISRKFMNL